MAGFIVYSTSHLKSSWAHGIQTQLHIPNGNMASTVGGHAKYVD